MLADTGQIGAVHADSEGTNVCRSTTGEFRVGNEAANVWRAVRHQHEIVAVCNRVGDLLKALRILESYDDANGLDLDACGPRLAIRILPQISMVAESCLCAVSAMRLVNRT
jgi:hypothetical protein